jgi:hypothetical protein
MEMQETVCLHSTGSGIISLTTGVKKGHIHEFTSFIWYPFLDATITLDENQGTIKMVKSSRLHENTQHLETHTWSDLATHPASKNILF